MARTPEQSQQYSSRREFATNLVKSASANLLPTPTAETLSTDAMQHLLNTSVSRRRILKGFATLPLVVATNQLIEKSSLAAQEAPADIVFPQTGKSVSPEMYAKWEELGGLYNNGYPISNEFIMNLGGKDYTVQYFERARFEKHPEITDPRYKILLGQLGREQFDKKYPNGVHDRPTDDPQASFFPQTGKAVSSRIMEFWNKTGGLERWGYPLSNEFYEGTNPGNNNAPLSVQYFERGRFEYHPENDTINPDWSIMVGLMGVEQYGPPTPEPGAFPREIGNYVTDGIVIKNNGVITGWIDNKIDPENNWQAVSEFKKQFAPNEKFTFSYYNTTQEVQEVIDRAHAEGKQYKTGIKRNSSTYPGTVDGLSVWFKNPDGTWELHQTLVKVRPEDINRYNSNELTGLLSFIARKNDPFVSDPEGLPAALRKLVLDPYNSGKNNFALFIINK